MKVTSYRQRKLFSFFFLLLFTFLIASWRRGKGLAQYFADCLNLSSETSEESKASVTMTSKDSLTLSIKELIAVRVQNKFVRDSVEALLSGAETDPSSLTERYGKQFHRPLLHVIVSDETEEVAIPLIEWLSTIGADLMRKDGQLKTIMHVAVITNKRKVMKKIVTLSPKLANMQGGEAGYTPLFLAILLDENHDASTVRYLIEKCAADPKLANKNNEIPIHYAASSGNVKTIYYLAPLCDINQQTRREKYSPLFNASAHPLAYDALLNCGARRDLLDVNGDTAEIHKGRKRNLNYGSAKRTTTG